MGGHLEERSRAVYVVLGLCLLLLIVAGTSLSISIYRGSFNSSVPVKLHSARAGLMLEPGSDVKMRDVVIGRVSRVELVDNQAEITMDIDEAHAVGIPENVTATIDPTTLFGRKFVTLTLPEHPAAAAISAGFVIDAGGVVTEVNDLLDSLVTVLRTVEPYKVNATMTALSTSLQGRGDQLGELMVELDSYLAEFNGSLPTLQRDLANGAVVADIFAKATPELLQTIAQVSTTSETLTDKEQQFNAFLLSFTGFGNSGREFFESAGVPLEKSLDALEPTTALSAQYSPMYPCFFESLDQTNRYLERTIGGSDQAGLNILGTLLMGDPPYTFPTNAPKNGANDAPRCYTTDEAPGHTDFDDGSGAYQPARTTEDLIGNPFAQLMFGGGR
ncbi:MAG: MCE family protein [Rhodococcus qingshengii]|jgi:phospholipid/cholesterol/gamma-HCH transport system substrate-binding protein